MRSVPARAELMKVKRAVPWLYIQGVSMELHNDRGRWGMAGLVSVGRLFHPKGKWKRAGWESTGYKSNGNFLEGARILHNLEIPMQSLPKEDLTSQTPPSIPSPSFKPVNKSWERGTTLLADIKSCLWPVARQNLGSCGSLSENLWCSQYLWCDSVYSKNIQSPALLSVGEQDKKIYAEISVPLKSQSSNHPT